MSTILGNGSITFGDGSTQSSNGAYGGSRTFTSSGTFTIPATKVKVTVLGAGGGGGSQSPAAYAGGGGGAGAAFKWLSSLTVGSTLAVTIGSGEIGRAHV